MEYRTLGFSGASVSTLGLGTMTFGCVHLSEEETCHLDRASDPDAADYPYGRIAIEQRSRNIAGDS